MITETTPIDSFFKLQQFFIALHRVLPDQRVVILIDEFDGTPTEAISPLLQIWRQIYNPIYRQVLIAYLRPLNFGLQGELLVNGFDFRKLITGNGLDMRGSLTNFRQFVERRGKEAFKVSPMPQEATGQYMLMAYLDAVLRQIGGVVYTEVPSGDGRLDLIVIFQEARYIIETKLWRGAVYFDRGIEQMHGYLASEA